MKVTKLPLLVRLLQTTEFPRKLGIVERFFGRTLAAHDICWVRIAVGLLWKLDLRNPTHRWIVYGKYEGPGFHKWARRNIPRDGLVIDSGANIGQMLLHFVRLVPQGRVLAFEPGISQSEWIADCLQSNSKLPVELITLGLGARAGTVLLDDEGDPTTHGAQSFVSSSKGVAIQVVRLEDELKNRGIEHVDLWKIDVEGYEVPALEGASTMLRKKNIAAIYVELHAENGQRIKNFLAGFGYRCYVIDDHGVIRSAKNLPAHTNGLFLHRAH